MIKRFLQKMGLIKTVVEPVLTIETTDFDQWYMSFRMQMSKSMGVSYAICISSWTMSYYFKHYFEDGFTPKAAIDHYLASKKNHY